MRKKIKKHYDDEAFKCANSSQSTMRDLFIRNLEVSKIEEILKKIIVQEDPEILEIGCGNGYTLKKLVKKIPCDFVGIDSNSKMIKLASKQNMKRLKFKTDDVLQPKIKNASFDIIFTERCLINLENWSQQVIALNHIHRILKKKGKYVMLEAFDDGMRELNLARKAIGLKKISPAWHNYYFNKKRLSSYIKGRFKNWSTQKKKITFDNFLSSYYFGSRILYPSLIEGKLDLVYNNKFVEYFSLIPSIGNYSPLQLCVLEKI